MRLMTYNLKGLHLSATAAVEVVRAHAPDVLGVQEPPAASSVRRACAGSATAVGMVPVVNGDGARTTALLVRPGLPVSSPRAVRLPWRPGTTRRGAAVAEVAGVTVVVVHLSLRPDRARRAPGTALARARADDGHGGDG